MITMNEEKLKIELTDELTFDDVEFVLNEIYEEVKSDLKFSYMDNTKRKMMKNFLNYKLNTEDKKNIMIQIYESLCGATDDIHDEINIKDCLLNWIYNKFDLMI